MPPVRRCESESTTRVSPLGESESEIERELTEIIGGENGRSLCVRCVTRSRTERVRSDTPPEAASASTRIVGFPVRV